MDNQQENLTIIRLNLIENKLKTIKKLYYLK